jgi:hypothetical protein
MPVIVTTVIIGGEKGLRHQRAARAGAQHSQSPIAADDRAVIAKV